MAIKVYYLDDEPALGENFKDLFETDEVEISTFVTADAFLEAVRTAPPDLVFLDYLLPKTNGDIVAQQLDPKIPKYLITGNLEVKPKADFVGVFYKPVQFEVIQMVISNSVNKG
jgi:FixJ family two-component response regulator